jgi:nucleoside 2-deoxyribosyltransferase
MSGCPRVGQRAQVCYELGLALALSKPSIVTARPSQPLPFNVNIGAVSLSGERKVDSGVLTDALQQTLGTIVWGGTAGAGGAGAREGLAWLERAVEPRLSDSTIRIAKQLAERSVDDAVAFRRSIEQLIGMLGADAPAVLLPAWPPAYPDPSKPRLFHVMPFRPKWARATRDLAEDTSKRHGWVYSRGDEAEAQRIIPGIWREIARASAVLVDVTGHNPNVALELGLVHALGRPYRVVAQGPAEDHTFESLEKVRIHGYGGGPDHSNFLQVVEGLLESTASE